MMDWDSDLLGDMMERDPYFNPEMMVMVSGPFFTRFPGDKIGVVSDLEPDEIDMFGLQGDTNLDLSIIHLTGDIWEMGDRAVYDRRQNGVEGLKKIYEEGFGDEIDKLLEMSVFVDSEGYEGVPEGCDEAEDPGLTVEDIGRVFWETVLPNEEVSAPDNEGHRNPRLAKEDPEPRERKVSKTPSKQSPRKSTPSKKKYIKKEEKKIIKQEVLRTQSYEGKIYKMSKNQKGCRLLQGLIDEEGSDAMRIIFPEIIPKISPVMNDQFGNYLVQKMIFFSSEKQRIQMIKGVSKSIVKTSNSLHGTRAIQTLIDEIETDREIIILSRSLQKHVIRLIKDINGNHVIQKFLRRFRPELNQFIYDSVMENCLEVAFHQHGCCVFQRCLDYATEKQKEDLISVIKENGRELVQNAFGNYVVQYILDYNIPGLPLHILKTLDGEMYKMSKQKFSSNVIEKCLKKGDFKAIRKAINEFCSSDEPEKRKSKKLFLLLGDSYGNYVIQTCLVESNKKSPEHFDMLCDMIKPLLPKLKPFACYKRIRNLVT
eukprot:TRINITY_DN1847_c0_g4_i2.p1 TRINITY_DN1847_c0_g4~~TRINITY_DN1847_c0_g4_i2.p1  ORF type:complete len:540 (-),score=130.81 TRINITY_DN1847_c0_g4_i2:17-1636(-)